MSTIISRPIEAVSLGYSLLGQYNIKEWDIIISDRPKRRLGCCKYDKKQIQLSKWIFDLCPEKVDDTVRHEVAHAVAGFRAGHGPLWKSKAIDLGANPVACASLSAEKQPQPTWVTMCLKCNKVTSKNYRKRSQKVVSRRISTCCGFNIYQQRMEMDSDVRQR